MGNLEEFKCISVIVIIITYNVFIFVFEGTFRVYCVHALIHVFLVHWYTPPGGGNHV